MCELYDKKKGEPEQDPGKRHFLKLAAASALALGIAGTAGRTSFAANVKAPPLPENIMTPEQALDRLMEGNERYATGQSTPLDFSEDREALVSGQNPYACILSCSDSRVSPEFCFDEQRGDLFVARVAGNYLTTDFVATLEYAAAILHTPLIMVLGHESCGAVKAAINALDKNEQFPGHIQTLASALLPAVRAVKNMPGDRYDNAVKMNVVRNVDKLKKQPPILSKLVADKKLLVVGGVYSLKTGRVDLAFPREFTLTR
ncbi:carbonic anhydrase [Nitrosospira sp. NpAV]|uniref:carbonic anhydrase n=1 Tax=Nitrosospira sp. NpAV TaxID=58133 RepID=UPI00059F19A8|nr:carbonic anhydrase [Nitrosospira sp. NpAV]KIO47939.1 carbonic anhydrase [Nitrosospira sp. NpAV]